MIVIVVLLAAVAVLAYRQRRSAQLRAGFGPEYDRVVRERGDQGKAEAELRERRERRRRYEIRPLDPEAQARYAERWQQTQARFVDQPASALTEADVLVTEVMRERGYPVDDFEQQAGDVSVDHPEVVEHYRKGHAVQTRDAASTEDLRQGSSTTARCSRSCSSPCRSNRPDRPRRFDDDGEPTDTDDPRARG